MSPNSYPSPISSSAPSPQLNATMDQPGQTDTRQARQTAQLPPAPPGDIDSVAASFRARLHQVRRDFMGISNGLPEPASQLRGRREVGPPHDALMLTGEPSPADDTSPNMSTQRPPRRV
ncbi:hypothetical protein NMY22_g15842 [Coprinellus aureogranulatus]|nr:hypothetical protein NMY22_g15842 [Coprinellus aureogranulatus]